ncbi:MAG: V-type ATP synthase subunit A, partial [Parachlamydiales bacterium]
MQEETKAKGRVVEALGNLLHVEFNGSIRQGEICLIHLGALKLPAEVIEINHNLAKVQVFEDTMAVKLGQEVVFQNHLLEAELGPGLLGGVFDGLQNPLEEIAKVSGLFLKRGVFLPSLDRKKKWPFHPCAQIKAQVQRGALLGTVPEGRFEHKIMVPFALGKKYTLVWLAPEGSYTLEEPVARLQEENGLEITLTMLQRWPVKM